MIGKLEPGIEPSVHAGVTAMAQPLDLILHLQFARFSSTISGHRPRMGQAFGNFVFERLMSSLNSARCIASTCGMSPQSVALYDLSVAQTHHKSDGTPAFALRQTGANL